MKIVALLVLFFSFGASLGQKLNEKLSLAYQYHNESQFKKAAKLYSEAIKTAPKEWTTWYNLGLCLIETEDYKGALNSLKEAYKLHPDDVIRTQIGFAYHGLQRWDKAIEYLERSAGSKEHDNDDVLYHLGSAHYFNKNNTEAIKYLSAAFEINTNRSGTLNNLGWSYLEIDPSKSCEYFKLAYDKEPDDFSNVNNLGYSYLLCGDYKIAIKYFKKAKKMNPENAFVYRNVGLYHAYQNHKSKACKNLRKAIKLGIIEDWGEEYIQELSAFCTE